MDDLLSEFLTETNENLENLDVELVRLEQNPNDPELISSLVAEAGRLTRGLVEDGKIDVDWPENGEASSVELTREATKLLLNLVLLGIEALPRGGTVKVRVQSSGTPEIVVLASGDNAGLKEESAVAMSADANCEALTARSVQGYFVNSLAHQLGTSAFVQSDSPGTLSLRIALPD